MTELAKALSLLNRFTLVSRLGRGGMAEVWLAEDSEKKSQVALKILLPRLASNPEIVALFESEAARCRRLSHPNIVRVYGCHADLGLHFIVMEYVPGGTAKELRGNSWQQTVRLLLPITDALDYAHQAGVVHRDLRASNILLDKRGRPRLTDFGIAGALRDDEPRQEAGGSLPAMSPQQLAGDAPAVSDDIYAFGALLFELVAGEPLFHPDVTPERIKADVPPRLSSLCQGVPLALDRLVGSLLEKQDFRRPPGMAAVRAALDELLADVPAVDSGAATASQDDDADAIAPVARRRANGKGQSADFRPRPLSSAKSHAGPGRRLYAGIGALAIVALIVVFVLPEFVADRSPQQTVVDIPVAEPATAAEEPSETLPDSGPDPVGRELADAALADLLRVSDRLRAQSVELWGGADWFAAANLVAAGDEAYKGRDFGAATTGYREALALLEPLIDRAGEVLQTALTDGQTAIDEGNQRLAIERFELALAIDPANLTAEKGRERAFRLDRVIAIVEEASSLEVAEQWDAALEKYDAALAIDSQWPAAIEGRDRVSALITGNAYQAAMSSGYAALAEERYKDAKGHFQAALGARPGDPAALQALDQIQNEQRLARVSRLNAEAEALAGAEDWKGAVSLYQAILAVDASVVGARDGLAESQGRAELDQRMRDAISSPDRLSDAPVLEAARQLLDYARGIPAPGPVLTAQISELDGLVRRAVVPVTVRFESDNLTEVVIYKVGRFAPFVSRNIELRPGVYTAVGARSGYRDVRLDFRVQPENAMQPVVIRCEDPI